MLNLRLKYLSVFFALVSILSFFNVLYSYYFNLYLNLDTYFYTLIVSLVISLTFYKIKTQDYKPNIFDKILTILFGYFLLPIVLSIPFYFSIYNITFIMLFLRVFLVLLQRIFIIWKYKTYWPKFDSLEIFNSMDRRVLFFVFYYFFNRYLWWKSKKIIN